ncbi:MAG: protocatechuate 3,4-dioxygenase subunit alpha [Pseudomonadota bacterium]
MRSNTKLQPETASQTAGPYVHIGLAPQAAGFDIYDVASGADIAGPDAKGDRIRVEGTVWDGDGVPVKDVLIETWQANADGVFAGQGAVEAGFRGWGRIVSDFDTGEWGFDTVIPGPVAGQAPHVSLWIVARGINIGLHTRLYFADDPSDPVLSALDPAARATLIATETAPGLYRFDIHLQGARETVFFDV